MDHTDNNKKNRKIWIKRGIRWLVGISILYLVFTNIDIDKFTSSIVTSDPWLIVLGLLHAPVLIVIAASRWRFLMNQYFNAVLPWRHVISHYWKGLALGFFTPASLENSIACSTDVCPQPRLEDSYSSLVYWAS